jgi:hypothetical protein
VARVLHHFRVTTMRSMAPVAAIMLLLAFTAAASAQSSAATGAIADVSGPGQAVSQPAAQCPHTISCDYAERNMPSADYRLQSLRVCGANCTTQYWVSGLADGQQLLELDPVRGGAVLAVAASSDKAHPSVRMVTPQYASGDPACCPSGFADTTYAWDATNTALTAAQPVVTPASDFPGWDEVRRELQAEGWALAGV